MARALIRWWFPAEPLARVAVLRTVLYLFVPLDIFFVTPWVAPHGYVPEELYQPVLIPRVLDLPTPTVGWVRLVEVALIVSALVAATGRAPRLAGGIVAVAYTEWMFIAMSYSKIDHDKFALLVAYAVLPTVGAARHRDRRGVRSEAAGFALRAIQVAVVLTYFLAAWAKVRHGGWDWANGAVFYWAMSRRGTWLGDLLMEVPWLLQAAQWVVIVAETLSPLLLVLRGRWRTYGVLFFVGFHLVTYLTITIHFLPHAICLLAFAPLERVSGLPARARTLVGRQRARRGAAGEPVPVAGDEAIDRMG